MNRRNFFKALTGAAAIAVTGLPKDKKYGRSIVDDLDITEGRAPAEFSREIIEDIKKVLNETHCIESRFKRYLSF